MPGTHRGAQMAGDDLARVAHVAGLGEVRDDVGLGKRAQRLQGEQLRIARADADTDQARAAHSPALASALTAAAAMALPPMRPRTPPPMPPPPRRMRRSRRPPRRHRAAAGAG